MRAGAAQRYTAVGRAGGSGRACAHGRHSCGRSFSLAVDGGQTDFPAEADWAFDRKAERPDAEAAKVIGWVPIDDIEEAKDDSGD